LISARVFCENRLCSRSKLAKVERAPFWDSETFGCLAVLLNGCMCGWLHHALCPGGPIMKLALGAPLGGGWGRCLLLQDIGVTRQAFHYDPRAQLSPASQPAAAVTQPLHAINL
jgi:hypothetical protein